jgi:hypothetical protein
MLIRAFFASAKASRSIPSLPESTGGVEVRFDDAPVLHVDLLVENAAEAVHHVARGLRTTRVRNVALGIDASNPGDRFGAVLSALNSEGPNKTVPICSLRR